ncbi:serine hydrolase domain-containing protein [Virgisporangium aurantiacum]|uniref:D-alanyl-D-alanine carboxypeptidase n=1 Tax=Virgisporangium aurantiacum TaxID=175570 RepID=A0A8J4EA67_9ACTN|nr:serine hydrolase domain-containing protein [Virgisporangium aurantiacum]GIJ64452.1 D-alanyl-D-alanine carboxypeptidase [Virgisporangium aurantiacum]
MRIGLSKRILYLVLLPAATATTVAVGGGAAAAAPSLLQRDLDALRTSGITGVHARFETPGGARVITSGVADIDTKRPVPSDPYIRIGSTTKTFTAVVVLQLVGEGRLSLSDPVEQWLPGLVSGNGNDGRNVTVRDLLRHNSGVHDHTSDLIWNYATPELYRENRWRTYTPAELVAVSMRHPPGTREHAYSNTNYVLAGMLIQAVTGRGWEREVHDRILTPLGLRRTLTPGSWPFLPDPHARNYHQFAPGADLTDTTVAVRGIDSGADGSMISTPTEVNRFFAALVGGRLLAPAQWAQMRELVTVPGEPAGAGAGAGIFFTPLSCGGGYWNHGGTGLGTWVEPAVTTDGRRRLTLSMFTNTFDPDLATARQALVRDTIDRVLCS